MATGSFQAAGDTAKVSPTRIRRSRRAVLILCPETRQRVELDLMEELTCRCLVALARCVAETWDKTVLPLVCSVISCPQLIARLKTHPPGTHRESLIG